MSCNDVLNLIGFANFLAVEINYELVKFARPFLFLQIAQITDHVACWYYVLEAATIVEVNFVVGKFCGIHG